MLLLDGRCDVVVSGDRVFFGDGWGVLFSGYLTYLEHSVDNGTQWAVFENNGPSLWARVKDSVDSFLNNEFADRLPNRGTAHRELTGEFVL